MRLLPALTRARLCSGLEFLRGLPDEDALFDEYAFPTTVPAADGSASSPVVSGPHVTARTRDEYVRKALHYRLHEFDAQMMAIRSGMARVVPMPLLSLYTPPQLEHQVCGSQEFSLDVLRTHTKYKGCSESSCYVEWFWSCMSELSVAECALFLRFVWGRARLPRSANDFGDKQFVLQMLDRYPAGSKVADEALPEAYTCFFVLKLPKYSSSEVRRRECHAPRDPFPPVPLWCHFRSADNQAIPPTHPSLASRQTMLAKLRYAIRHCKSIDADAYARI